MDRKSETKTLSNEQIGVLGFDIYDRELRARLEETESGKWIAISLSTHEYYLGRDSKEAAQNARQHNPNDLFFVARIGG